MKSLIFSILCIGICLNHIAGDCVMRTHCANDEITLIPRPCKYDGKPVPLTDENALNILKEYCPRLQLGDDSSACCDADQVEMLQNQISVLAALFKRCPSCFYNLANVFCQLTCSPRQSEFLQVTESVNAPDNKESVNEVYYYISEKYTNGLFESCENVKLFNVRALDVACGPYGKDCSPRKWLKYLGSHDPSPYQIIFQHEDTDKVQRNGRVFFPMNRILTSCSEPAIAGGLACDQEVCPHTPGNE